MNDQKCGSCGWYITSVTEAEFAPLKTGQCALTARKHNPHIWACPLYQAKVTSIDRRRLDLALYYRGKRV